MKLVVETSNFSDYVKELEAVDYSHPSIQELIKELFTPNMSEIEKIKSAYEFVRDQIAHSWDIQSERVTYKASDVLKNKEGICYAKSNLLAALLRSLSIPTGFCYQRLMIFAKPEDGYSLHALNAVYIQSLDRWVRLDARGNKQGVQAQFSLNEEKLAFQVREKLEEIDYPVIFKEPNEKTISVLQNNMNALKLYVQHLPDRL